MVGCQIRIFLKLSLLTASDIPLQAQPLKVCVTGAAGQIAYSLLYSLAKGEVYGENQVRYRVHWLHSFYFWKGEYAANKHWSWCPLFGTGEAWLLLWVQVYGQWYCLCVVLCPFSHVLNKKDCIMVTTQVEFCLANRLVLQCSPW